MAEPPQPQAHQAAGGEFAITVTATADGAVVITPTGDLDMATSPVLVEQLDAVLAAGHTRIVVDLTRTDFFGSAGIAAVITASDHARRLGINLRIVVDDHPMVTRALAVTGVADTLPIYRSLDEALST